MVSSVKIFRPWVISDNENFKKEKNSISAENNMLCKTSPPKFNECTLNMNHSKFQLANCVQNSSLYYRNIILNNPIGFINSAQFWKPNDDDNNNNDTELKKSIWNKKPAKKKTVPCPFCKSLFNNNGQLKGHIRIHTGEKPFKCNYENCNKSFTRNEELTRHKRIHTGERPYSCEYCGKTFGRKDHLKKHIRIHFSVKGYQSFPLFAQILDSY